MNRPPTVNGSPVCSARTRLRDDAGARAPQVLQVVLEQSAGGGTERLVIETASESNGISLLSRLTQRLRERLPKS